MASMHITMFTRLVPLVVALALSLAVTGCASGPLGSHGVDYVLAFDAPFSGHGGDPFAQCAIAGTELLTGVEGVSSRPVRRTVLMGRRDGQIPAAPDRNRRETLRLWLTTLYRPSR
jgi:hypothetical protein